MRDKAASQQYNNITRVLHNLRFFSNYFGSGRGFHFVYQKFNGTPQMTYRIGACGGRFSTPKGVLTSPSYPEKYPNYADCIYTISQPNGSYVNISFLTMDINCQGARSGYVELRDGDSRDSPLMGRFCGDGSNVPDSMQTTQNSLMIRLQKKLLDQIVILLFTITFFSGSFPTSTTWDSMILILDSSLNSLPSTTLVVATSTIKAEY